MMIDVAIESDRSGHGGEAPDAACGGRASLRAESGDARGMRNSLAAVVAAAAGGDRDAMGVLYERYAVMVHAVLLTQVSVTDAEDLTQDVFVTAMGRLGEVRHADAVGGWLASVARSRAVDFHRSRARRTKLRLGWKRNESSVETGRVGEVMSEIRALPEAYREILMMRLVAGMSGPEIATRTGMTHGSVRVNLHRGMAILRQRLGTEEVT